MIEDAPSLFSCASHRIRIVVLLMISFFVTIAMRVNINVAMVSTVDVSYFRNYWNISDRRIVDQRTDDYRGTLQWSPPDQALLYAANFIGSLITLGLVGFVVRGAGPKWTLSGATLISLAMTVATPILSQLSYCYVFAARVVLGAAESFIVPSLLSVVGQWIPASERFIVMELITSASPFAASFVAVVSSSLSLTPLGWPVTYYFYGGISAIWLLFWLIFGSNSPKDSTFCSESEKEHLKRCVSTHNFATSAPWRAMLSSAPFWTCLCCQIAAAYTGTIMQGFLPTFVRDEMNEPLIMNGLYTLIPFGSIFIFKTLTILLNRMMADYEISSPTVRAKCFQTLCSFGCAAGLIFLGYFHDPEENYFGAAALAVFGVSFACGFSGFAVSVTSLSPQHNAVITQITVTITIIASILGPVSMWGFMMMKLHGIVENIWRVAFTTASAINIISGLLFLVFGKVGEQNWSGKSRRGRWIVPSFEDQDRNNTVVIK